jgi:hypothetical protein
MAVFNVEGQKRESVSLLIVPKGQSWGMTLASTRLAAAVSRQICHWLSCGRVEPALRLRVRKSITQLEKHIHLRYITSLLLQFPLVALQTSSARCVKL